MEPHVDRLTMPRGYDVIDTLGIGGAGWVLKVRKDDREYACKILKPSVAKSKHGGKIRTGFEREAQRMAANPHQNLVEVYKSEGEVTYKITTDETICLPFFLMEIVEGRPFLEWLEEQKGCKDDKLRCLVRMAKEMLDILHFLHTRPAEKLMHLDIKSDNVLVTGDLLHPRIKILDFGVAQAVGGDSFTTDGEHFKFVSTYRWMPEEFKKHIRAMEDRNAAIAYVPRDLAVPSIDLHLLQAMIRVALDNESITLDELRGRAQRLGIYFSHWLDRLNWDTTPKNEGRLQTAKEAIDKLHRAHGWPTRPSILYGRGNLRLPLADVRYFGSGVAKVVDHPTFRKLKWVRQLGLAHEVFNGANHTRDEHCKGTFAAAIEYLRVIARQGCPEFRSLLEDKDIKMTAAACLLHDIGHYPFSHQINERRIRGFESHETRTYELLRDGLAAVAADAFEFKEEEFLEFVLYCSENIASRYRSNVPSPTDVPPAWTALRAIVNGPIDADKYDYLRRDAHHAGVPYMQSFDPARFLGSLTVISAGNGRSFQLAVNEKGTLSAEMFLVGRYFMYAAVYFNHTLRMFDRALQEAVERSCPNGEARKKLYVDACRMSDDEFLKLVAGSCGSDTLHDLLIHRKKYERLITVSYDEEDERTEEIFNKLTRPTIQELRELENSLRDWLHERTGHKYAESELLLDLPGEKKIPIIPIVSANGKKIERGPQFRRAIHERFNLTARKLRIFVVERPKGWNPSIDRDFRTHLHHEVCHR